MASMNTMSTWNIADAGTDDDADDADDVVDDDSDADAAAEKLTQKVPHGQCLHCPLATSCKDSSELTRALSCQWFRLIS